MDWLLGKKEDPVLDLGGRQVPLIIRRRANSRRMVMRLAPDGSEVRLTVPRWCRTAEALTFARTGTDWLGKQLDALVTPSPPQAGGTIAYRGADIVIGWDESHPRRPALLDGEIRIGGPLPGLELRLRRWLEAEAIRLMEGDLVQFCTAASRPIAAMSLSRAQRRWGSCSAKGDVRLNWRLVQAPDFVRRSVVAHEVAHLVHFDHSPAFHALLRKIYDDDLDAANLWLKRHGRSLYATFG